MKRRSNAPASSWPLPGAELPPEWADILARLDRLEAKNRTEVSGQLIGHVEFPGAVFMDPKSSLG